jgi:hypothetical protein
VGAVGRDYFRRDQADDITPPNLGDDSSTYAEHIVHARGQRTRYTSLSTDPDSIKMFGPQLWRFHEDVAHADGHGVVSHEELLAVLRQECCSPADARAQDLALRALPRARMRREALVLWRFDTSRVARKLLTEWAQPHVRKYFSKV